MDSHLMDDAAFLNAPPPAGEPSGAAAPVVVPPVVEEVQDPVEVQTPEVETTAVVEPGQEENQPAQDPTDPTQPVDEPDTDPAAPVAPGSEAAPAAPTVEESPVDYAAKMAEALAPLKANGKMVPIQSVDELRQLASMGANFTRKMQDIAPHRRILTMLEANGLLDEDKLSLFIDVDKKNPQAIAKLIKDTGVDPLDIDTSTEPAYQAGGNRVTDSEMAFRTALEDLQATETGSDTISHINQTWDKTSKEELWSNPGVMATIDAQRNNGVYAKIQSEIERQSVLGYIPAGTPFLTAYVKVGEALNAQGAFAGLGETKPAATPAAAPAAAPIATRVVAPKAAVTNGAAASAAAATRQSNKRVVPVVNLDNMSDDEFLKSWSTRL